jgi:hypothetical protein
MPFDATLPTAADRCRAEIGDTSDPPLLVGGEGRYIAMMQAAASEPTGYLAAARALRAQLALQPVRKGARGVTVDYTGRLASLDAVIGRLEAVVNASGSGAGDGAQTSTVAPIKVRW